MCCVRTPTYRWSGTNINIIIIIIIIPQPRSPGSNRCENFDEHPTHVSSFNQFCSYILSQTNPMQFPGKVRCSTLKEFVTEYLFLFEPCLRYVCDRIFRIFDRIFVPVCTMSSYWLFPSCHFDNDDLITGKLNVLSTMIGDQYLYTHIYSTCVYLCM